MEEREYEREWKRAPMQEPAAARAPKHFVRVKGGPTINKRSLLFSRRPLRGTTLRATRQIERNQILGCAA